MKTTEQELLLQAIRTDGVKLYRDLQQARKIIESLLPDRLPRHPRLDCRLHYQPMQSIGGDFISLPSLPGGGQGIFLADLMGHGVPAALHMALLKFLSDRLLPTFGMDPKGFLEHLNRQVRKQMRTTFVAGLYGWFQFPPGRPEADLWIAGAGHPGPLLQRAGTEVPELVRIGGNGALGILSDFETAAARIELSPGDRVFLFTDGLPEAFNAERRQLGLERLSGFIGRTRGLRLPEAFDRILDDVDAFRDEAPVSDDVVLAGFEVL
jgi:serine phosphatase RsbU (regulator of sigma subunit)